MIPIYLSLLIAIIGAILYFVSANGKVAELGRLSFGVGLLAFLLHLTAGAVILPK